MAHRVLLADDSLTIQKVVELTFSEANYDLMTVGNGLKAVEALDTFKPELVLTDVVMPGLSGYEVCEASKARDRNVPVVLLTGTFEPFDRPRAERAGCDHIVTKPFDSQQLATLVADLLLKAEEARLAPGAEETAPQPPAVKDLSQSLSEMGDVTAFVSVKSLRDTLAVAPEPATPAPAAQVHERPAEPSLDMSGDMYATTALRIPSPAELDELERRSREEKAAAARAQEEATVQLGKPFGYMPATPAQGEEATIQLAKPAAPVPTPDEATIRLERPRPEPTSEDEPTLRLARPEMAPAPAPRPAVAESVPEVHAAVEPSAEPVAPEEPVAEVVAAPLAEPVVEAVEPEAVVAPVEPVEESVEPEAAAEAEPVTEAVVTPVEPVVEAVEPEAAAINVAPSAAEVVAEPVPEAATPVEAVVEAVEPEPAIAAEPVAAAPIEAVAEAAEPEGTAVAEPVLEAVAPSTKRIEEAVEPEAAAAVEPMVDAVAEPAEPAPVATPEPAASAEREAPAEPEPPAAPVPDLEPSLDIPELAAFTSGAPEVIAREPEPSTVEPVISGFALVPPAPAEPALAEPEIQVAETASAPPEPAAVVAAAAPELELADGDDGYEPLPRDIEEDIASFEQSGLPQARPDIWEQIEANERAAAAELAAATAAATAAPLAAVAAPPAEDSANIEALEAEASRVPIEELIAPARHEDPITEPAYYPPPMGDLAAVEAEAEPVVAEPRHAVALEAPPAAAAATAEPPEPPALRDEDVDRIARRVLELLAEKIERVALGVAWDVVPEMAERLVKERIRELENA